jgi:hypothetical protein
MKLNLLLFLLSISIFHCSIGPTHGILITANQFAGEFNPYNDVESKKSATGCQHNILTFIAFGDASAGQLAQNNHIERIATIDHSTVSVLLFIYSNYCTIVTGE